jgi:hypothetical protein
MTIERSIYQNSNGKIVREVSKSTDWKKKKGRNIELGWGFGR